jgi:hypothetical protein
MAAELFEAHGSYDFKVGGSGTSGTMRYVVLRAADQDEAYALVLATTPAFIGGIPRGSLDVTDIGGGNFEIHVEYSSAVVTDAPAGVGQPPAAGGSTPAPGTNASDPLGPEWSFSTKGGTQHIKLSRFVRSSTALAGLVASDPKKRIGDSEKGTDGIDIQVPQGTFSVSVKTNEVTWGYFLTLMDLTGTTNDQDWKGAKEGCLLFGGAEGSFKAGDGWNLTYHFDYRPEETDIEVAAGLTVPLKLGHEVLDVRFRKVKDAGSNVVIEEPYEAHVHSVYRPGDFDVLQL